VLKAITPLLRSIFDVFLVFYVSSCLFSFSYCVSLLDNPFCDNDICDNMDRLIKDYLDDYFLPGNEKQYDEFEMLGYLGLPLLHNFDTCNYLFYEFPFSIPLSSISTSFSVKTSSTILNLTPVIAHGIQATIHLPFSVLHQKQILSPPQIWQRTISYLLVFLIK